MPMQTRTRKTGDGTNYSSPFRQMDPYSTTDATLSYSGLLPHTTLQLSVFNLLGKDYYDPGNQSLPRVLQAGRTVHLRLVYGLPGRSRDSQVAP